MQRKNIRNVSMMAIFVKTLTRQATAYREEQETQFLQIIMACTDSMDMKKVQNNREKNKR